MSSSDRPEYFLMVRQMNFLKNWFLGVPSQDQFAKAMLAELRRAGDTRDLQYQKEHFRLVHKGGEEINLTNMYQEHCQLPRRERSAHLKNIVAGFVAAAEELPESFEDARPNLRPKIWLRAAIVNIDLRLRLKGEKGFDSPNYPLGEHLVTSLVYDMPTSMRGLSQSDLEKWGVTYYEAMEAACQNLEAATTGHSRMGTDPSAEVSTQLYSAITGDNYDSSRILLKDSISSWEVAGDHVAMVPQRDTLFVTGSNDDLALEMMLSMTEAALKDEPRPLSPIPLRLVDGEWDNWIVPKTHKLFDRFEQLKTNFMGDLYAEQKELLEAVLDKEKKDVFVASFSGMKNKSTGNVVSYCVWPQNVDSLLPKTSLIMFANEQGVEAIGEWDHVAEIVGDLLTLDDSYYPVRYRVNLFPTPEQLKAIGMLEL